MYVHDHASEESPEAPSLFTLNSLSAGEDREFRAHLETCENCRREVRASLECLTALEELEPTVAPPSGLKERILARIASDSSQAEVDRFRTSPILIAAKDLDWEKGPVPGLYFKRLHLDPNTKRMTMLVRLDAGGAFPPHVHRDFEESLLLEGDLCRDGILLKPGDYQYAAPGSTHAPQQTRNGCVLWVSTSMEDAYTA